MIDHCIGYLYSIRYLAIEFLYNYFRAKLDTSIITARDLSNYIIFENSTDIFFANNLDRYSVEDYIFKLFRDIIN